MGCYFRDANESLVKTKYKEETVVGAVSHCQRVFVNRKAAMKKCCKLGLSQARFCHQNSSLLQMGGGGGRGGLCSYIYDFKKGALKRRSTPGKNFFCVQMSVILTQYCQYMFESLFGVQQPECPQTLGHAELDI